MLEFNVTWNAPQDNGGSIVLDYKITLLYANKSLLQQHSGIKNTWFTLKNLQQNRTYIFILQAKNVVGYGEPSNVSVSTLEAGKRYISFYSVARSASQTVRQADRQAVSQLISH